MLVSIPLYIKLNRIPIMNRYQDTGAKPEHAMLPDMGSLMAELRMSFFFPRECGSPGPLDLS